MIELINHKNTDKFLPGRPLVAESQLPMTIVKGTGIVSDPDIKRKAGGE